MTEREIPDRYDREQCDKEQGRLATLLGMLANGNMTQHDLAELAVLRQRFKPR